MFAVSTDGIATGNPTGEVLSTVGGRTVHHSQATGAAIAWKKAGPRSRTAHARNTRAQAENYEAHIAARRADRWGLRVYSAA